MALPKNIFGSSFSPKHLWILTPFPGSRSRDIPRCGPTTSKDRRYEKKPNVPVVSVVALVFRVYKRLPKNPWVVGLQKPMGSWRELVTNEETPIVPRNGSLCCHAQPGGDVGHALSGSRPVSCLEKPGNCWELLKVEGDFRNSLEMLGIFGFYSRFMGDFNALICD